MPRPRTIDPEGRTVTFGLMVSERIYRQMKDEAQRRNITLGAVARERLEKA